LTPPEVWGFHSSQGLGFIERVDNQIFYFLSLVIYGKKKKQKDIEREYEGK
jgi:hypothetical protein